MNEVAWAIEHSVDASATLPFAWKYMTDVKNWDDPPAEFKLNGPFASGSPGTTEMPGQAPLQWRLRDVNPHDTYTMEIALEGAAILCKWMFIELTESQTRMTQLITLQGENAASYKDDIERAFASNLAPGMSRIAVAIGQSYAHDPLDREQG